MEKNFVFLDEMLPGVRWDAKYATWDNFTGKPVDGYNVNRIVGTKELGTALRKAQKLARKQGYGPVGWLSPSVRRRLFSALGVTPGEQPDEKTVLPKYKKE